MMTGKRVKTSFKQGNEDIRFYMNETEVEQSTEKQTKNKSK